MSKEITLECPKCGKTFTADTEEEAKRLRKQHAKKQHSE